MVIAALAVLTVTNLSCERSDKLVWHTDHTRARQLAIETNRILIVHFALPGRPLSDAMESARRSLTETPLQPAPVLCSQVATEAADLCRELGGGGVGLATCFWHSSLGVLAVARGHASAADLHDLHARAHRTIELLATTPTDDFDRLERGRRFYELGARHRADTWFRVALAEASTDAHAARATAHSWLARIAVDDGDFEEARRQLHEASRLPTPADAVRHLATALLAFGERNPNAALEALRLANHAGPTEDTKHQLTWLTGCTYHELNRDSEAVATLVPLATGGPRHWRARAKQQLEHMAQDAHTHEH